MNIIKDLSVSLGSVVGNVVGGTVRSIGEHSKVKIVEVLGDTVQKTSILAGETVGLAACGTLSITAGILTQNSKQVNQGVGDVTSAFGKTGEIVTGAVQSVVVVLDGISQTFSCPSSSTSAAPSDVSSTQDSTQNN